MTRGGATTGDRRTMLEQQASWFFHANHSYFGGRGFLARSVYVDRAGGYHACEGVAS
jgi:hypothetical protein